MSRHAIQQKEEDPFQSVLATARRIGFKIPQSRPTLDAVQEKSSISNLRYLTQSADNVFQLRLAITALTQSAEVDGFLETQELTHIASTISQLADLFASLSQRKITLAQNLKTEGTTGSIPVELEHQSAFYRLIRAVAQDKYIHSCQGRILCQTVDRYRLFEMILEARQCMEMEESPMDWKVHLQALDKATQQLIAAHHSLNELSRYVQNHT